MLAFVVGLACACGSWQAQELSPREDRALGRLRVIQTDSIRVELEAARVVEDTLVGVVSGLNTGAVGSIAIPLSRVSRASAQRTDVLKTAAMVAVGLVLVAGVVFALAFRQGLSLWYDEIAEIED